MAKSSTAVARLGAGSVKDLEWYLKQVLSTHKQYTDLRNKLTAIDLAYYRYLETSKSPLNPGSQPTGVDESAANTICCATDSDIQVPVVISQVGSFVGYLAEVYLSGYPLFPVLSDPKDKEKAELLESIIDTHSIIGGYGRQFLKSFFDGIKYNFMPIENSWEGIEQYNVVEDALKPRDAQQLASSEEKYTAIRRWCPYNTVWDFRVNPADVAAHGEFIGHIDLVSRIPLKTFINKHSTTNTLYNISKLSTSRLVKDGSHWHALPQVNRYVTQGAAKSKQGFDWDQWMNTGRPGSNGLDDKRLHNGVYERFTCYARIIPSEFGMMSVPRPNSPCIWKFIMLNSEHLIHACPIYSAYDLLPGMIGQPLEDSFGVQTESIGEGQIPMQESATKLFSIRFNSARRSLSDRAIFDPMMLNESDVNAPTAAPKIPLRVSGLNDKTIENAYRQIPFDNRGTDGLIGDVRNILEMANMLSGLNKPFQGQFQKGNKSVKEWDDTMSGADTRLRLPALMTEMQIFVPIKNQLKLNIFQHGVQGIYQNKSTGAAYEVDAKKMKELRDAVMSFRIADGFTPKSKQASTAFLNELVMLISNSPLLQQQMGPMLPMMIGHLAQLGGVRGLDQYIPQQPAAPQQGDPNAGGQPPAA